jgi:hypothetical protein
MGAAVRPQILPPHIDIGLGETEYGKPQLINHGLVNFRRHTLAKYLRTRAQAIHKRSNIIAILIHKAVILT